MISPPEQRTFFWRDICLWHEMREAASCKALFGVLKRASMSKT